jgi:hypothetical protein
VVIAIRWPLAALIGIVALVPFSQVLQSWLWFHTFFPAASAIRLGYAKELIIGVAFLSGWRRRPRPLARVDLVGLGLLVLVGVYMLAPLGPAIGIRYVAARANVGFIAVFLAARWLVDSDKLRQRAQLVIPCIAGVVASLGIWNRLGPDTWSNWVDTIGILPFRRGVMNAPTIGAVEKVPFGGGEVIRAGSVLFSPNDLAYFMIVIVGLIAGRMVCRVSKPWEPFIGGLCTLCLFFTFSRSAMALFALGGLVVAAASGRLSRAIGVVYTGGIVLILVVVLLGAGDQLASGTNANDQRTAGHISAITHAAGQVIAHPAGSGLGTTGSASVRFDTGGFQTENFYLHVGVEVGVLGAIGMVAFIVIVMRMLWRRARESGGLAIGVAGALAAVATGGLVLETFSELATGWTLWLLAGLALAAVDDASAEDVGPEAGEAHGLGLGRERAESPGATPVA